jgi:hypothetical protein
MSDISLNPMLFVGTDENTSGGWHNFEGYHETIEEAQKHVENLQFFFEWAHIVVEGKIVKEGFKYESGWKWQDY